MALYDFTLTAGSVQQIDVVGDSVILKAATGTVEMRTDTGQAELLMPGQGWADLPFKRLYISDRSGAANRGSISVYRTHPGLEDGNDPTFKPRFIDNRITGDVSIIDGGKSRSVAGSAFFAGGYQGLLASNYAAIQLLNPAGSGKNLVVESFDVGSTTAQPFNLRSYATALTNLYSAGVPKLLGSAAGVAQIRVMNTVPIVGSLIYAGQVGAAQTVTRTFKEPIYIPPAQGLVLISGILGNDLTAAFEWFEE